MTWNGLLLCGFDRHNEDVAMDVAQHPRTEKDLADALFDCYPELSTPELARLYARLSVARTEVDNGKVFGHFARKLKVQDNASLRKILGALAGAPGSFQAWVAEKRLVPRDLSCLSNIAVFPGCEEILVAIAGLEADASEGMDILLLCAQLLAAGQPASSLVPTDLDVPDLAFAIRAWRERLQAEAHGVAAACARNTSSRWQVSLRPEADGIGVEVGLTLPTTAPRPLSSLPDPSDPLGSGWPH